MACTILDGLSFMCLRLKLWLQKASWSTHHLPSCWSQAGLQSWEDLQWWWWRRLPAVREIWTHCRRPAESCCTFDRTKVRAFQWSDLGRIKMHCIVLSLTSCQSLNQSERHCSCWYLTDVTLACEDHATSPKVTQPLIICHSCEMELSKFLDGFVTWTYMYILPFTKQNHV